MTDSYEPIRTALSECFLGDTSLARLLFTASETFDQRVIGLIQGLGIGADSIPADAISAEAIRAVISSLSNDPSKRSSPTTADVIRLVSTFWQTRLSALNHKLAIEVNGSQIAMYGTYGKMGPGVVGTTRLFVDDVLNLVVRGSIPSVDLSTPSGVSYFAWPSPAPYFVDYVDAQPADQTLDYARCRGPRIGLTPALKEIEITDLANTWSTPQGSPSCMFTLNVADSVSTGVQFPLLSHEFAVSLAPATIYSPVQILMFIYLSGIDKGVVVNLSSRLFGSGRRWKILFRLRRSSPTTNDWKLDASDLGWIS